MNLKLFKHKSSDIYLIGYVDIDTLVGVSLTGTSKSHMSYIWDKSSFEEDKSKDIITISDNVSKVYMNGNNEPIILCKTYRIQSIILRNILINLNTFKEEEDWSSLTRQEKIKIKLDK